MMGWPSTSACPKELAICTLDEVLGGTGTLIGVLIAAPSLCSLHTLVSAAAPFAEDSDSSEDHALRSYPHPHLKLRYVCMIRTSRIPTGTPGALVSLERDTWSPGPPTANTRLHLVGTGHVGSWWVLVRRRPSMRPPARRSSADSRSMRKHHLLRILSLAGTLGALEAASLLVQLRSQHRTLLCPRLCQVWHVSEGDGPAARGSSGCAAYSCPWPSRHLVGRPEAWSCQSSAFGGLPSGSAAAGYARRELVRRIRVWRAVRHAP